MNMFLVSRSVDGANHVCNGMVEGEENLFLSQKKLKFSSLTLKSLPLCSTISGC